MFELNEVTIDELQQKMQSGTYTSKSITDLYLKRIEMIDKKGPALNAVIEKEREKLAGYKETAEKLKAQLR